MNILNEAVCQYWYAIVAEKWMPFNNFFEKYQNQTLMIVKTYETWKTSKYNQSMFSSI